MMLDPTAAASVMNHDRIDELAAMVRDEAETYTKNKVLAGWCCVFSASLVAVYRAIGLSAEMASGEFKHAWPHCWVYVCQRNEVPDLHWEARADIIDITATQFDRFKSDRVL